MLWELYWGISQICGSCVNHCRISWMRIVGYKRRSLVRMWIVGTFTEGTWGLQRDALGMTTGLLSTPCWDFDRVCLFRATCVCVWILIHPVYKVKTL